MCRKAEPAGMGDALAVDDKNIGLIFEFFDGSDADGSFTKGKQAWDIGKGKLSRSTCCFDKLKSRFSAGLLTEVICGSCFVDFQDYSGGDDSLAIFTEGAIQAGNQLRLFL